MRNSKKPTTPNSLTSATRDWKAFALKRNPEGGWDMVEMMVPTHVVNKFEEKRREQDVLGNLVASFQYSVAKYAQR